MIKRNFVAFLIAGVLLLGAFYGQAKLGLFISPCEKPITFSIGDFDEEFGLTKEEFIADIENAISVWEQPTGIDLFRFDERGKLKINLVYDYRQEATERLKNLGLTIDDTQASYESLKSRYNFSSADYQRLKQSLDAELAEYNKKKAEYEASVKYWNSQGGAPKNTVNQLNAERDTLNNMADRINRDQKILNDLGNSINDMVEVLNRMAANLNLSVQNYNTIGASRGEEFEEGTYVSAGRNQEINIYEFSSKEKLTRLLAHEFGHALGLEHVEDENAIMYRLNTNTNPVATDADLNAIKQLCGI